MRISVQSGRLFESFGMEEAFALLQELGFEAMDFGIGRLLLPADILAHSPDSLLDGDFEALIPYLTQVREAAQRHGIAFSQTHAPFPAYRWGDEQINLRMPHALENSIRASAFLGAPYCIIHPALISEEAHRPTPDEEWAVNRAMYSALIPVLRETGVVCCLENLFSHGEGGMIMSSVCSDSSLAAAWIDQLNELAGAECFGFCFDTGHCHLTHQNQYHAITRLGHRLKALHVHDNIGYTDQHLAPYMGSIYWDDFVRALRDIHYQGDMNFETFNVLGKFPPELHQYTLQLVAETGKLFRQKLSAE